MKPTSAAVVTDNYVPMNRPMEPNVILLIDPVGEIAMNHILKSPYIFPVALYQLMSSFGSNCRFAD